MRPHVPTAEDVALVRRYVGAICSRRGWQRADIEDAIGETLWSLCRSPLDLDGIYNGRDGVVAIIKWRAALKVVDITKKHARRVAARSGYAAEATAVTHAPAVAVDDVDALGLALRSLKPIERETIDGVYGRGDSVVRVAADRGEHFTTTYRRMRRAVAKLRAHVAGKKHLARAS